MLNDRELSAAIGTTVYDADGDKIGTVEHFFVDDRTGAATWVAVTTGLFGTRHSVVPATGASFAEGALRLPVHKEAVKSAPQVGDTGHLDPETEAELRRHYGLGGGLGGGMGEGVAAGVGGPGGAPAGGTGGDLPPGTTQTPAADPTGRHAAPGSGGTGSWSATETTAVPVGAVSGGSEPPGPVAVPDDQVAAAHDTRSTEATDGAMTRSEERLRVDTERVPSGRVRLVKYVVTEEVQVTVPIRREEVRLEEIPLEGDTATAEPGESLTPPGSEPVTGAGLGTGTGLPDEIVLHAERPVVTVEVVPVERVRLRTEEVVGEERITDQLQREQIVLDQS